MIVVKILLLAAHLLMMNIAAAGPMASIAIQFFGGRRDEHLRRLGQKIAASSLACFFFGTTFGLVGGWLMWLAGEQQFFEALGRFPSKIFFGVWELVFYVFCMGVYIAWWRLRPPQTRLANILLAIVGLAATTNLLWHFPALMTAIAHVAATEPSGDAIDPSGFRELIFRPQLMSHWLHVWMASFATTGLFVSWYALRLARNSDDSAASQTALNSACTWGGRVALTATLLQMPLGMWLLLSSPQAEQSRLMGGDLLATGFFLASLVLALALMHQLAAIAIGNGTPRNVSAASAMLVATITLMSGTLLLARGDSLKAPYETENATAGRASPEIYVCHAASMGSFPIVNRARILASSGAIRRPTQVYSQVTNGCSHSPEHCRCRCCRLARASRCRNDAAESACRLTLSHHLCTR